MTNNEKKTDSHLKRKRKIRWILMCLLWVALAIIIFCLPNLEKNNIQNSVDLVWRIVVMLFGSMGIVLAFNREEISENQLATSMKQLRETAEVSFHQRYATGVEMIWRDKGGIPGCKILENLGIQDKNMSIQCAEALLVVMTERIDSPDDMPGLCKAAGCALSAFFRKWGNDGSYPNIRKLPIYFWESAEKVYFPEVDLKGVDLSNMNLNGACFSGADLRKTNLEDAKFIGSDLRRADFREASLKGADFTDADCRDADFSGNDLTGVTFVNTKMKGANLEGTDTSDASFPEADFD